MAVEAISGRVRPPEGGRWGVAVVPEGRGRPPEGGRWGVAVVPLPEEGRGGPSEGGRTDEEGHEEERSGVL